MRTAITRYLVSLDRPNVQITRRSLAQRYLPQRSNCWSTFPSMLGEAKANSKWPTKVNEAEGGGRSR